MKSNDDQVEELDNDVSYNANDHSQIGLNPYRRRHQQSQLNDAEMEVEGGAGSRNYEGGESEDDEAKEEEKKSNQHNNDDQHD